MLKAINVFVVGLILKYKISNIPAVTARPICRLPMSTSPLKRILENQI
jgi:hypothetical protein